MKLLAILIFCLSLQVFVAARAQGSRPLFHVVDNYNNIGPGKIGGITQDKYGYMWFLDQTHARIIRFDGYRMKSYRNIPGDSSSLGGGDLETLALDSSGNLWISYTGGLDKFNPQTEKFTHYYFKEEKANGPGNPYLTKIIVDHANILWIATFNGLDRFDPATEKFTHYRYDAKDPKSISGNAILSVYEDRHHNIWAGAGIDEYSQGGLNRLDQKSGQFTRYLHEPGDSKSLANNMVWAIYEDTRGNLWIGTNDIKLQILDQGSGSFRNIDSDYYNDGVAALPAAKHNRDHITFITEDRVGALWVGLYARGVVRIDTEKKFTSLFGSDQKIIGGFTDSSSWCGFVSREGTLWIATLSAKTYRLDPLEALIETLKLPGTPWCFYGDSSRLMLGFQRAGFGTIPINNQKAALLRMLNAGRSSDGLNGINDIHPVGDGQYLMASWEGLLTYDTRTDKIVEPVFNGKPFQKKITCIQIIPDKDGFRWYLSGLGFHVLDTRDQSLQSFFRVQGDSASLSTDTIIVSRRDFSGKFWIGTLNHGINHFDLLTHKAKRYLPDRTVFSIAEDDRKRIWVGTDFGLYFKDSNADSFALYQSVVEQFKTAAVSGLLADQHDIIWGVSDIGIFRLNPEKNEFALFGRDFGITETFNGAKNTIWQSPEGDMYIGKINGYYRFPVEKIVNEISPQIILTGFKIDRKEIKGGSENLYNTEIEDASRIRLNFNQNIFSIDFAAIHFSNPTSNIIEYKLEGYENVWRQPQQDKTAYYFNIPPGEYTFRIKANSRYGINAEKTILILVSPPWWKTWLAYLIYLVLTIIAILAIIRWRTNALLKDKKILEEKVSSRTQELKEEKELVEKSLTELKATQAQLVQAEKMASLGELTAGIAHEIQNPLNFVNNFSEINKELVAELKEELKKANYAEVELIARDIDENEGKINHHGKRADAIVKGMLQHSRISTGLKEPTDINALADEYLRLAYHGLRARDKTFNAAMKTDFDPGVGIVNLIPQDIGRVFLNIINNAFYAVNEKKATAPAGYEPLVSVTTKRLADKIIIKISDNGNGIPKSIVDKIFNPFFTTKPTGQGTGLGLSLSYDIIKAHGGEIKIETTEGEGSEFQLVLNV